MKKIRLFIVLAIAAVLFAAPVWGSEGNSDRQAVPAILAALNPSQATALDDDDIADIRGQAQYVMVRVLGINTWDWSPDVPFTLNPLGFVYGNFGGIGVSGLGGEPVDLMDELFQQHDIGDFSNADLRDELKDLPLTWSSKWGNIYQPGSYDISPGETGPDDTHFGYKIKVSRVSLLSAGSRRFFFSWQDMPLTEYARREAYLGMAILSTFSP